MQEKFEKISKKETETSQKELVAKALAIVLNKHKNNKSNYILAMEYGFSTSLLNLLSRGKKDPQITTIFKLSQALGMKASKFVEEMEKNLPEGFRWIEN